MIIINKKIPKVFANKVESDGNNKNVFYSNHKDDIIKNDDMPSLSGKNIGQKISDIFNSPNYIYKADVIIKLKDKTLSKRVVGRNKKNLITMENELIPISEIVDIKRK